MPVNGMTTARARDLEGGEWPAAPPLPEVVGDLAIQRAAAEAVQTLDAALGAAHRALTDAQRLERALAELTVGAGGSDASRGTLAPRPGRLNRTGARLTRREHEVLALVAAGRSNREIAMALFLSPNTVKTHVRSLLTKLHVGSRVQLAAIATQHGLDIQAARNISNDHVSPAGTHALRGTGGSAGPRQRKTA